MGAVYRSLIFVIAMVWAHQASAQVTIGGNYKSDVTTGSITNSAVGDGAVARRCVGGIDASGQPVKISGDVTVTTNGKSANANAGCVTDGNSNASGKEASDR